MKKIWFIALASILLGMVSCGEDNPVEDTFYTVSFDADGGTPTPEVQRVKEGDKVTTPSANPAKEGYVFLFWHLSGASTAYNFATPVTGDITLMAQYEEESAVEYWQVTWNLNSGAWTADDNHAVQVVKGGMLAEPVAPTKAGNTFEGWYKEAGLTNKVTFPYDVSTVTGDFTLYAKWTAEGGGEEPGIPAVYVCGDVENEKGINVVKVWKDGEELYSLTDGTRDGYAHEIFVAGNDVYVVGSEENANGTSIAKVWKNGTELYALNPITNTEYYVTNSIYVAGNDVYVAGYIRNTDEMTNHTPQVWKNGQKLYTLLASSDGMTSKICGSGSDVYVSGTWGDYESDAAVWKNGSSYWVDNPTLYGYRAYADYLYISKGKIYVAISFGLSDNSVVEIRNRETIHLYEYDEHASASIESFAVSDSDVYAAVQVKRTDFPIVSYTEFYRNETELYSISGTQYMYLFGEDIYSTGGDGMYPGNLNSRNGKKVMDLLTELNE